MGCFRVFSWHLGLPWLQHESTFGVLAGVGGVGCAGVGCLSWVVFLFSVWVHFRDMALPSVPLRQVAAVHISPLTLGVVEGQRGVWEEGERQWVGV